MLQPLRGAGRLSRGLARVAAAAVIAGLLSGCGDAGDSLLHPHGMVAAAQRDWLLVIVLLMMLVVLPIFVMVPLFAWRYRRRGGASYQPDWTYSRPLEVLIWGVPVVIVALLAVLIITRETRLDPYAPLPGNGPPLEVDVVALNWKFLFIYPEQHVASLGLLAIPVGRPVEFHLTSDATMQSFFIPALGSQIYAMAGMVTQLHLRADRPGPLDGENTQFNGNQFQNDHFHVDVLPADGFDRFLAGCQADGRMLDQANYAQLAKPSNTVQAKASFGVLPDARLAFGDVEPGLFDSIVAKYRPGEAPGAMSMPDTHR